MFRDFGTQRFYASACDVRLQQQFDCDSSVGIETFTVYPEDLGYTFSAETMNFVNTAVKQVLINPKTVVLGRWLYRTPKVIH